MNSGKTIFSQILDFIPWRKFNECVLRYAGDKPVYKLKCHELFRIMLFAQIMRRESLSDIVISLVSVRSNLYHAGIVSKLTKSKLARANNQRSWRIFCDFAEVLRLRVEELYERDKDIDIEVEGQIYALDSTIINLCMSLFPWAKYRSKESAVKAHTLLSVRGSIPDIILISKGNMSDSSIMEYVNWESGSWYIMDKAYVDFDKLYSINTSHAWFVTRDKKNIKHKKVCSIKFNRGTGIVSDQKVKLTSAQARKEYPKPVRRIKYIDAETGTRLIFLTNNMDVDAVTIAKLYKSRWRVELFFKWIKQHLHVLTFFGRTVNAVKSQLWIAVCVYMLLLIIKKELKLRQTQYQLLQIFSMGVFHKTPIKSLFDEKELQLFRQLNSNQLELFQNP